jgi:hypothetical protein
MKPVMGQSLEQSQAAGAAYMTISRALLGGGLDVLDITGSYVLCLASNLASFKLGMDGGPSQFFAQGIKIRLPSGRQFKQLIVDNTANQGSTGLLNYTLGIGIGDITDARLITTQAPNRLGANFATLKPAAAGVTQLLNPAINVNGVNLRTAVLSTSAIVTELYCDTAAPAAVGDTTKRMVAQSSGGVGGAMLQAALFLPAGIGIWLAASGADANASSVSWDLL